MVVSVAPRCHVMLVATIMYSHGGNLGSHSFAISIIGRYQKLSWFNLKGKFVRKVTLISHDACSLMIALILYLA